MSVDVVTPPPEALPEADRPWRTLVDKTLAGASFTARLTRELDDGLRSAPLYLERDAPVPLPVRLRAQPGFDADRRWDVRVETRAPRPAEANAEALEALQGGAASILLRLGGEGRSGTVVADPHAMDQLLEGVHLDLAPIALDAGSQGTAAARLLAGAAERRTLKPRLQLHLDPLSAAGETGLGLDVLGRAVADAAKAALEIRAESAFLASGRFVHEAGGGEALELGTLGAALLAYIRALLAAGDDVERGLGRVMLGLSLDQDYFLGIAKIRAARRMFEAVAVHLGVKNPPPAKIEARSSGRMLSALDVHVNMLRATAAAFAGGAGGADILILDPFDAPLGAPSALGRRQSRNIQLELMQEGGIAEVRDPAGGSFYLERLGADLAERGWAQMQAIERAGGLADALLSGRLADQVGEARRRKESALATRRLGVVGVTEFPNPADPAPPPSATPPSALGPIRFSAPFEALRRRASAMTPPPRAYLVQLGSLKDYAPRAGFAAGALAVGGVGTDQGPLDAYQADLDGVVVLCGTDEAYGTEVNGAVAALKARGAKHVLLAGRDPEGAYAKAGVAGLLFAGMDHIQGLSDLLDVYAGAR